MSSEPLHIRARSASLGKEVTPSPEAQPPAVPAPAAPTPRFVGRDLPASSAPTLLPGFKQISAGLGDAMTRQRLEDAVIGGFLSASEAEQIARAVGLTPDKGQR